MSKEDFEDILQKNKKDFDESVDKFEQASREYKKTVKKIFSLL